MEKEDKIIAGVLLLILAVVGFLFFIPVQDGNTVLTMENGEVVSPIGDDEGGLNLGDGGDSGSDDSGENEEEEVGEPCTYPESFDIPSRSWWFVGQRCPPEVEDFFNRADDTDCYEIESSGNVYDYRSEITAWYHGYLKELNWEPVEVSSSYLNREGDWAWGGLYRCRYNDRGLIVLYAFRPKTTSRTSIGTWGQAVGDWDYMKDRADKIEELVSEMME